ncbi:MAG: site-specific integrase [Anaerolineales bacterium]|nr:site-specific integrase [Anaerolineales bacterium]
MNGSQQLSWLPTADSEDTEPTTPGLSPDSSLQAALSLFEVHMRDKEGFALNTVKAFASDIRLLGRYLGVGQPIGHISTDNLNQFLNWLLHERGVPCSPKSYARRVTTLKVFFKWLHDSGVLLTDPATAVIQHSVKSPLPTVPTEDDLDKALAASQAWRRGTDERKADARPHLLLTLLLQTGIKKSEAMNLVPNHVDRHDPHQPMLFIRYKNPNYRYKERKLPIDPDWLDVLDEYLAQYAPPDTLFTCTPRNLEYVLRDIGDDAGLDRGLLSFENLRWASALRDFRAGTEQDDIRQKLGLSKITWRETKSKLEKLVARERGEPIDA